MCGIAGSWGTAQQPLVREMMARLAHRGPDSEGIYVDPRGNVALGHRRLAIMDPEGGNQPIENGVPRRALVANGEIYNHAQLKQSLPDESQLQTGSDCEVLLWLFEEKREHVAEMIDGMYAFAIADGDHVFAARDPLGIKPLYTGRSGAAWLFASEMKALVGLADDIREFPPGSYYHSARGLASFYEVPTIAAAATPVDQPLADIRSRLDEAVGKRLMSDVPVGAFLSGGLDSSLIVALARPHVDQLHTFSIGIEGSPDLDAARHVARHLDTVHHEHVLTEDEVCRHLPEIIYHLESYDQDLVRSAVPCYFVSQLAAEHVKVVLTGEGADELFAGYEYYRGIDGERQLQQELRRSIQSLHNINLQRVDRMTMAHGLEGRVPFLDLAMIELAQRIPPGLKLHGSPDGKRVEKWALRKACEDLLPAEIVWRDKQQFDEGSQSIDLLGRAIDRVLPADDARQYSRLHANCRLRSREECAYHKLLTHVYRDAEPILQNVARWSERPTNEWS